MLLSTLENEIHVWFCCPDEITDKARLDEYHSILSSEERKRQQGFHYEKDQHSYLISHALVRASLSKYCDVQPHQWSFTTNEHGKPAISSSVDCPALNFNLSHADGLSACVVSLDNECGVDVENTRRQNKLLPIAERMFAEAELETLRNHTDDEIRNDFFDYWTLREAYVKALGTGLSGSSKLFYFKLGKSTNLERTATLSFADESEMDAHHWQFSLLKPSPEHVAAVAYYAEASKLKRVVSQQMVP